MNILVRQVFIFDFETIIDFILIQHLRAIVLEALSDFFGYTFVIDFSRDGRPESIIILMYKN